MAWDPQLAMTSAASVAQTRHVSLCGISEHLRGSGMRRIIWLAALSSIALVACEDPEEDGLAVGTYNAGLAPGFVPFTEQRTPLTIAAIADESFDLLCVQEVWEPAAVDALRDATRDQYPSTFFPAPDPGELLSTGPACELESLAPLSACVTTTCGGLPTDQLTGCVVTECETELTDLDPACSTCLAANIGATFETIAATCTTEPSSAFAFGGSFGIGLLSRYELLDQDFLLLDSTFNRRGVIYSRVETDEVGEVHVFCTHLTAIFDDIPFPQPGGSWEGEQRAQIEELLAFVDEKTAGEGRVVLMGDLNTGPERPDLAPEEPLNYALFVTTFVNPFLEDTDRPECTFCASNPLVPDDADSVAIDHVLVRALDAGGSARRFLTENVEIDVDGTPTEVAFSDHYGVRAWLLE